MIRPTIKQWEVKGREGLMEKRTVTSYMIRRQRTLPPTIITGKAQESVFKVTLGDGVVSWLGKRDISSLVIFALIS